MEQVVELFMYITHKYIDRQWAKSRDDLISRVMKALRAFKDGKTLEEVKKSKELSFEIEDSLEVLQSFALKNPHLVDKLIKALGIYVKAPAPCKTRLISLVEVFLEDIPAVKE